MPDGTATARPIGPYSKPLALAKLDGRTRESRLMCETRRALVAHVGGRPSVTQAMQIERAVQLTLRVAMMDQKFAETGAQTEHDTRTYLAWSANLARVLRDLGMKAAPAPKRSIAEYLAETPLPPARTAPAPATPPRALQHPAADEAAGGHPGGLE